MLSNAVRSLCNVLYLLPLLLLQPGCSAQNEQPKDIVKDAGGEKRAPDRKPAEMPKRDPAREVELAAQREKRLKALEPVEKKVLAGLRNWKNVQKGEHGEFAFLQLSSDERSISEVIISPDASKLALPWFQEKKIHFQVVDFASGKEISRLAPAKDAQIKYSFSPDSELVAAGGFDRQIAIWDINKGKVNKTIPVNGPVWYLVFAPDGKHVLASVEGTLKVIDAHTGKEVTTVGDRTLNATEPAISPSGNLIASVFSFDRNKVGVWETASGSKLKDLSFDKAKINGLAFSVDGWKLLLLVSADETGLSKIVLWNLESNEQKVIAQGSLHRPALSPDGKHLAFLDFGGVKDDLVLFDLTAGKEIRRIPRVVGSVAFSPGGLMIASVDNGRLRIWSAADLLAPPGEKDK